MYKKILLLFIICTTLSISPFTSFYVYAERNDGLGQPKDETRLQNTAFIFQENPYQPGTYSSVKDTISGKVITNSEAISDIVQAERDALRFYDTAILNGKDPSVAQKAKDSILKAGSARASAKQENGAGTSGGFFEQAGSLIGLTGTTNERLAKIAEADSAYKNSLSELAKETGNLNTGFNDPNKYNTSELLKEQASVDQSVARDARSGVFTVGQPTGDTISNAILNSGIPIGGPGSYELLAPIETFFPGGMVDIKGQGLSGYLNGVYRIGIAVATGLALIMIVIGGLEYVSTDSIQGKSNGKDRIKNSIIGLLLALTSFIIVRQINPNLTRSSLNVEATQSIQGVSTSNVTLSSGLGFQNDVREGVNVGNMPYVQQTLDRTTNSAVLGLTTGSKIRPRNIPDLNWSSYALQLIRQSRLPQTRPSDAASYFPGGIVTAEGWLAVVGGIIEKESSFNPRTTYQEPLPPLGPGTLSVGLMQMSKEDPEARRKGYSSEDLKNPYKNLEVGIGRLEALVTQYNCITCYITSNGKKKWIGASAYWSVLRP